MKRCVSEKKKKKPVSYIGFSDKSKAKDREDSNSLEMLKLVNEFMAEVTNEQIESLNFLIHKVVDIYRPMCRFAHIINEHGHIN